MWFRALESRAGLAGAFSARELFPTHGNTLTHVLSTRTPKHHPLPMCASTTKQEPEYCEQIPSKLFENTMHTLLKVLRNSQGKWDAREQRGVAAYARGLQLLLSGYGKDIHEVKLARSTGRL